jgi:rhodanese-related sulfurtransferase
MSRHRHKPTRAAFYLLFVASLAVPLGAAAEEETPAIKAMLEYLDFTEYSGGVIFPEQIEAADYPRFFIVDTRMESQFAAGTLPDAVNIEWRQLLARRAELPRDKPVLIYCHTGMLSAQAAFALRIAGIDNIKVLQGGYLEWQRKGGVNAARP